MSSSSRPGLSTGPDFYENILNPPKDSGKGANGKDGVDGEEAIVTKCQFQDITEIRRTGQDREVCLTSQIIPPRPAIRKNPNAFKEYSVILRRIIEGDDIERQFEIQSASLRKAFRDLIPDTEAGDVDLEANPITIHQPYRLLFHSREKIRNYTNESLEIEKEMKLIADFLAKNEVLQDIQKQYNQLRSRQVISFPLLWTIYPPGEFVVVNIRGTRECWRIKDSENTTIRGREVSTVWGHGTDYDGTRLGLIERTIFPPPFTGVVDIGSLHVVPLSIYPETYQTDLKTTFIHRGRRFKELLPARHFSYEGPFWDSGRTLGPGDSPDLQINERVMVDCHSYMDESMSARPELLPKPKKPTATVSIDSSTTESTVVDDEILTDDDYLLCPARIPGFCFVQKKWGYFLIEKLNEVPWREESLDLLEMDPRKKNLVRALVKGHQKYGAKNQDTFDDVVNGKGNGLVFMLQGPPGLGKTLMAEVISEYSKRPLYQISSGELSNEVPEMETQIKRIFKYGRKWDAIVLLDEADVLMSNRDTGDLASNAIVSVFLRLIEYYEGILFLTTNRPTHFDQAICNRVHLTLAFEKLTPAVRRQIWKNILSQNFKPPSKLPDCWTEDIFVILGNFDVNGRTIKNLLRTASCYARSEEKPLGVDHLNEVMQVNLVVDAEKTRMFKTDLDILDKAVRDIY